tara:strand:- start:1836 stop:2693 length:858 start_codon:yes stop_codon:yes gene_type:complete
MTSSDPIENYEKTISELKNEIELLKKSAKHYKNSNGFCPWDHCESTTEFVDNTPYYYNEKYNVLVCKTCYKTTSEGKSLFNCGNDDEKTISELKLENENLKEENEKLKSENSDLQDMDGVYDGWYTEEQYDELENENKKLKNRIENGCKLIMELSSKFNDHHHSFDKFNLGHIVQLGRVCHCLNGINGFEDDSECDSCDGDSIDSVDDDDDDDNEYYKYGMTDDGEIIVAGGGLPNGNAMATIWKNKNNYYWYCEYDRCGDRKIIKPIGNTIEWNNNNFKITETK